MKKEIQEAGAEEKASVHLRGLSRSAIHATLLLDSAGDALSGLLTDNGLLHLISRPALSPTAQRDRDPRPLCAASLASACLTSRAPVAGLGRFPCSLHTWRESAPNTAKQRASIDYSPLYASIMPGDQPRCQLVLRLRGYAVGPDWALWTLGLAPPDLGGRLLVGSEIQNGPCAVGPDGLLQLPIAGPRGREIDKSTARNSSRKREV
ncbi:hypothetical protein B0J13DRAFT_604213, partial [Dactylonectria estremocensis]